MKLLSVTDGRRFDVIVSACVMYEESDVLVVVLHLEKIYVIYTLSKNK